MSTVNLMRGMTFYSHCKSYERYDLIPIVNLMRVMTFDFDRKSYKRYDFMMIISDHDNHLNSESLRNQRKIKSQISSLTFDPDSSRRVVSSS